MKRVLFVCSGNTCRSPLAEGIAKDVFQRKLNAIVDVSSAGTAAVDGFPASDLAARVAEDGDIDISNHRSRLLMRSHIMESDLIVTMEERHREAVGALEPAALRYTFLITDFCDGRETDVPDPIGGGPEAYEQTYALLRECIETMGSRLDDFDGWKKS